jgi:site-specific DNA-methyltransferase (adenine-specific)
MQYIQHSDALKFVESLPEGSVDLVLTDPPYYGIVKDSWDNQWSCVEDFVVWLFWIFTACRRILKPTGSIVFFGGIGKSQQRPLLRMIEAMDRRFVYQNWITWAKKRAYGKKDDYLFTREEILWYTMSEAFTFNIPLLAEKRGYAGFNAKYPAKSEFKRVTNVWSDIPELFRPKRYCQKPEPLMARLIETHSNPGNMIIDPFAGYGSTGLVALKLRRQFQGCEIIEADAVAANQRCKEVIEGVDGGVDDESIQQLETNNVLDGRTQCEEVVQEVCASSKPEKSKT